MNTRSFRFIVPVLALATLSLAGCDAFAFWNSGSKTPDRRVREPLSRGKPESGAGQPSREDKFLDDAISLIRDRGLAFDLEANPLRRQARLDEIFSALDTFAHELNRRPLETEDVRCLLIRIERHRGEWRAFERAHRESLAEASGSVLREHTVGKALTDMRIAERIFDDAKGFWNDDEDQIIRALVHLRRIYGDQRVIRHLAGNAAIIESMQNLREKCIDELNDKERAIADSDQSLPGYPEQADWPENPSSPAFSTLCGRYNAAFAAATR